MSRASVFFLFLLAAFSSSSLVQAQSKVSSSTGIWPELQFSYGLGEAGLLFVQNQYRINTDSRFNDLRGSGPLSSFERVQFSFGYEHSFTEHWRGGALWRHAIENYPTTNFYSLFLTHTGKLGSLYFNKQLGADHVMQERQDASGRYRLLGELGKRIKVKNHYVTPQITYETFLFTKFEDKSTNTKERFVDRTRLRFELTYEANTKFRITPYLMRQTDYYYVEVPPVYDENDILITDGYRTKRNRITPVIGLELKYSINRDVNVGSITY